MGWEVLGSPSVGPEGIGRLTQRSGKVREAHPKVQKTNTRSGRGQEAQPEVWKDHLGFRRG